jgi:hypothetical protein
MRKIMALPYRFLDWRDMPKIATRAATEGAEDAILPEREERAA